MFPCSLMLSFSFFLQIQVNVRVLQTCSKNNLSEKEYEIVNIMRVPKNEMRKAKKKPWTNPHKHFYHRGLYFSSFFLQFPPHMQLVNFHLSFILISFIFINKIPINVSCLFNAFVIAFSIFLIHNKPNEHPLLCFAQHSAWNTCPMTLELFFFY